MVVLNSFGLSSLIPNCTSIKLDLNLIVSYFTLLFNGCYIEMRINPELGTYEEAIFASELIRYSLGEEMLTLAQVMSLVCITTRDSHTRTNS